jgi:streptogramin lyase
VGSVASGGAAQAQAIAADSNGTVWVGNFGDSGGNVALLNSGGTLLSPAAGYGSTSGISPINIALDSNHTAWVASWGYANETGKSVSYPYITSIAGAGTTSSSAASPTITKYNITSPVTYAIAVDPSNNVWFTSGTSESAGFNNLGYIKSTGTVGATAIQTGGMINGVSMATDAGSHVWVANSNPTSLILTLSEFSAATGSLGTALSPSTGYGLDTGLATAYVIENIPGLIIDSSGSLWLPNTYQDQPGQEYFNDEYPYITVFVGLATPTQTPLLGVPQAP